MLILDACVGAETMYEGMNKNLGDSFVSIDIRKGDFSIPKSGKRVASIPCIVKPKILASMKKLPFKDSIFDVVIIDPPHLSGKSLLTRIYGSWSREERVATIYYANKEFSRVLKPNGILILKILPEQKDSYMSLLSNFIFFLPIYTVRRSGCVESKKQKEERKKAALWLIGIKKDE